MPSKLEVYKCDICGNIVQVLFGSDGDLVCCGEPMKKLAENTEDKVAEKHVPVVEKIEGGYKVTVGSVQHPMEEKHYIEWIELIAGDKDYREFLKPGMKPEAVFMVDADQVTVREHCNIHGMWRA